MHRHEFFQINQTKWKWIRIEGGEVFLVNCVQSALIGSQLGHKLINNKNL